MKRVLPSTVWMLVAVLLAVAGPVAAEVELFVTVNDGEDGYTNKLGTIDPNSGEISEIGATGAAIGDIAFTPDGRLLGVDIEADALMMLDLDTGAATLVGLLGFDLGPDSGLAVDDSGAVWLLDRTTSGSLLYSVDPITGAATLRGDVGEADCAALAALGSTVYGDGLRELVIDTSTGLGTPVGTGHSTFQSITLTADPAGALWSVRYFTLSWGPWVPFDLVVTNTRTWQSQGIATFPSRWGPCGLAARRVQQQAIPILSPLLLVLLVAVLATLGSMLLSRWYGPS